MPLSDCCDGNAKDTYFTLKLFNLIMEKLEELGMAPLLENIIVPSTSIFAEMELSGLNVDLDQLKVVGKQLLDKNINQADDLYLFSQVPKTANLASNNDMTDILYTSEDGFGLYPPDKTSKGAPSVSAPTLKLLLEHIDDELKSR